MRAVDLYRAAVPAAPNGRPPRELLAAARPTVSAWAYALLGTTLAIVYAFTALTKLDAEWRTGLLIQRLATSPLISIGAWAERQSMPAGVFWETQALSGLIAEIVVAVGYLLAPRLDDRGGRWPRP